MQLGRRLERTAAHCCCQLLPAAVNYCSFPLMPTAAACCCPQVRDALLHPETRERLLAMRRWVEGGPGAPEFPPSPLSPEQTAAMSPSGPLYGNLALNLDWCVPA